VAAWVNPTAADDQAYRRWFGHMQRLVASPARVMMAGAARPRHPRAPALHSGAYAHPSSGRRGLGSLDHSRYLAEHNPDAKYFDLPGRDHWPWMGDSDAVIDEIEEFVTGTSPGGSPIASWRPCSLPTSSLPPGGERTSVTRRWRDVLERHNSVRQSLQRFRGHEVKTIGDGFLATFDGPAQGIRCARAIVDELSPLGVELRAGPHTRECEAMNGDLGGVAVHIGACVAARAQPGEVLVSSTVKDLVAGSEIDFQDRGEPELKGVPGRWRLFAVAR
jgi:hypothetical protein